MERNARAVRPAYPRADFRPLLCAPRVQNANDVEEQGDHEPAFGHVGEFRSHLVHPLRRHQVVHDMLLGRVRIERHADNVVQSRSKPLCKIVTTKDALRDAAARRDLLVAALRRTPQGLVLIGTLLRYRPRVSTRIVGREALTAKRSAVGADGQWRVDPIDGLRFRPTRPIPHEDGTVAEVARTAWPEIDRPIEQVHITTTQPGRIRAWGLHQRSVDRLFVVTGLVSLVVYDGRRDSPTFGALNEFKVSERNPGLLVIAPGLFHGWKNLGTTEAFIINMPSVLYDYDSPDALDLPYDAPEAASIVPFRW